MPTSERLTFPNAEGHLLAARLDLPENGEATATVLFAHCFTCSKDLHAVRRISDGLTAKGLAVLAFDFTGLGQSEGAFEDTSFSSTVADLVAAANHLAEIREAPCLLIGHSLGGAAVLAAAEQIPSAQAVVTIGAPADPEHVRHLFIDREADIEANGEARVSIGGRPFTIRKQFLDDLQSHDKMEQRIAALNRALLIFHAPGDQIVGIANAAAIYKAARHPKSFVSLDDADHLLSASGDACYVADVIAAWAARYLERTERAEAESDPPDDKPVATKAFLDPTVTARIGGSGYRTEMTARGFSIVADEPASVGGTETGPTPYDFLGMALGACTAMTLRMYADRKKLPLEGVEVTVTHDRIHAADCMTCESKTGSLDRLARVLTITGALDEAQRSRMLEIADRCPVHRTLHSEIRVETSLREG